MSSLKQKFLLIHAGKIVEIFGAVNFCETITEIKIEPIYCVYFLVFTKYSFWLKHLLNFMARNLFFKAVSLAKVLKIF